MKSEGYTQMQTQIQADIKQDIADLRMELLNMKREILGSIGYAQQKAKRLEPQPNASDDPATPAEQSPPQGRSDAAGVPYEKVRSALLDLAKEKGRDIAIELLKSFGVTTAKDLTPDTYSDVYLTIKEAML